MFDEGFFLQWGKSSVIDTNYFSDPEGNVLNIEFEESLLIERQFCGITKILGFYNLDDVGYVCTLYCRDRYFRLRVFELY